MRIGNVTPGLGYFLSIVLVCTPFVSAQNATRSHDTDPWLPLRFLEGTWNAKTVGGSAQARASGSYTFRSDLNGHVLARYSSASGCKGPADYDCNHSDLFYVYQDAPDQPLKAIYFDNEGRVIHYSVSTPAADTVVFLSDTNAGGPRFRLAYELKNSVMEGKFQMLMPGKTDWISYLEWSGSRKQD
jgi:hypothetical protein